MKTHNVRRALTLAGLATVLLAAVTPAMAQPIGNELTDADRECIMTCRESDRDCRFDAREAFKLCLEEAGCDALADDYRAACLVEDRDEEACAAARTALRECRAPCRETAEASNRACREAFATCLSETCGLDELPNLGRGGPHHGPQGGPHRPGGFRGHH